MVSFTVTCLCHCNSYDLNTGLHLRIFDHHPRANKIVIAAHGYPHHIG
jgi:hypothetical protein